MKTLSITIFIALTTITVSAQTTKDTKASQSQTVEQVIVRGNRRIPESDIKSWISTHEDGVYTPRKLDRDVHALFDTAHFTDVRVYVEDGLHDGKIITFEVTERPLILSIDFEGIDPSQQAQVAEQWRKQGIELSKDTEYDLAIARRAAKIIQEFLNEQRAGNLKVIAYVERQTATEVSVTFKVEKADREPN